MITQNPTIGRASGSIGNVISQTIYEQNVLRSKPLKYRDKKSASQLLQRSKMSAAMEFLKPKLSIYRNSFKNQAHNKSVYSATLSYLIKNCVEKENDKFVILPEFVKFSLGDLFAGVTLGQYGFSQNKTFHCDLQINRNHPDALDSDLLYFFIWNVTTNKHHLFTGSRLTSFFTFSQQQLQTHQGDYLAFYTWLQRADFSRISNSELILEFVL